MFYGEVPFIDDGTGRNCRRIIAVRKPLEIDLPSLEHLIGIEGTLFSPFRKVRRKRYQSLLLSLIEHEQKLSDRHGSAINDSQHDKYYAPAMSRQNDTTHYTDNSVPEGSPSESTEDFSSPLYHGVRGLAVKILTRVDRSDSWIDKLLDHTYAAETMDSRDRRLLRELTGGVMRHRERLDWVLTGFYHGEFQKCIPTVKNALRVALYQLLFMDRIPHSAAVNESVEIVKRLKGKRSSGIVNGILRNIIRKMDAITWPNPDENIVHYLSVMESHPQWMVRRWIDRLGPEETTALVRANNIRPVTYLRVDVRKTTV